MTVSKRLFDILLALGLSVILAPLVLLISGILLLVEGRPVFYIAERMATPARGFGLVKFRTMRSAAEGDNGGVTGGDKVARMSRFQRGLRRSRADEIPQLWNVLRGDMSFVGPRPPLRLYVEAFPALYSQVLRSRPGITGLASLAYHRHEEHILAACATPEETDRVYRRRCVPRKAAIDLLYQQHRTLCLDVILVVKTAARPFRRS